MTSFDDKTTRIRTSAELGKLIKQVRQDQSLLQSDIAGLAGTGNRFIVDLERGKPTLQLQKVLDTLDLMGLEVIIQRKGQSNGHS
ncbi:transcriptional regulator [Vreelandella gomseomensis]|uniref:Transcriptional regulator n=1 Tax=Vreelandella gomseomensis TaxID=370766 RepID=A0ABU1GFN5_9GAMM|nr:transcriptional regulator [Halomonas gomseomensis]MDR5876303.1 transcriptional regulator [Halomonas gomseomensis]